MISLSILSKYPVNMHVLLRQYNIETSWFCVVLVGKSLYM